MAGSALTPSELSQRLRVWQAPLVPIALAFTAGAGLDRLRPVNMPLFLVLAAIALLFWMRRPTQALAFLWLSMFLFGAAYHAFHTRHFANDSLSRLTTLNRKPVRLQGIVATEGQRRLPPPPSPLRTYPSTFRARFFLDAHYLIQAHETHSVSGRVEVWLEGAGALPQVGERIEITGILRFPEGPSNPGGFDRSAQLRDQGIVATLDSDLAACRVLDSAALRHQPFRIRVWLRRQSIGLLERFVPPSQRGLAVALLLGDSNAMTGDDWDVYMRTGVIHALAISGQHLMVLAGFLGVLLRLGHLTRRRTAPAIVGFLFAYAVLTGGRPPVMRAVWMVLALSIGARIRRPVLPANALALAWILVGLWQPSDLFQTGCLLSFLAVAALIWGISYAREEDPVEKLLAEQRPIWMNLSLGIWRWIRWIYLVNGLVWVIVMPLIAFRMNIVSPIALFIGPLIVLGTSIALLSGFLTLILGALAPPLGYLFGTLTGWSLAYCQSIATVGDGVPGAYFYVAAVSAAWLLLFYLGIFSYLTISSVRRHPVFFWTACALWLALGVAQQLWPRSVHEFRCTFLAVDHGGCVVLEAPDGAVFLYDAGAMAGPEVTRQHIAPFLWQRGIRTIDEVFLSHADLDHFNGIPALLERFSVGRISLTPSFAARTTPGVAHTLEAIERRRIPTRIVSAGAPWTQNGLDFEILHPPTVGPPGNENARSMVLRVEFETLSILLTGDLEKMGLEQVLRLPARRVDVLMAPHHGGRRSNTPELAKWAAPRFAISCQGRPRGKEQTAFQESRYLTTWEHGAVTVRAALGRMSVETFRTEMAWRWD